jgi:hypothetical protein
MERNLSLVITCMQYQLNHLEILYLNGHMAGLLPFWL